MTEFGALLTTSGLIVNSDVTWLTFHSCYDFGYLMKTICVKDLPLTEKEFLEIHRILFPVSYDLKMLLKIPGISLKGGLQDVANQLCIERIGSQHQAGSDSLLTARSFFRFKEKFFNENWKKVPLFYFLNQHIFSDFRRALWTDARTSRFNKSNSE